MQLSSRKHGFADRYPETFRALGTLSSIPLVDWRVHDQRLPHGENTGIDDSSWEPVDLEANSVRELSPKSKWYRARIILPSRFSGRAVEGARLRLRIKITPDAREDFPMVRVFLNGIQVGGTKATAWQIKPIPIMECAVVGAELLISVHVASRARCGWSFRGGEILVTYKEGPDPSELLEEFRAAEKLFEGIACDGSGIQERLEAAVKSIDVTSLEKGDERSFVQSLEKARSILLGCREWTRRFSVRAIGHAHIDSSWLTPWTETVELCRNDFRAVLQLMEEYPDFKYTQSSAQHFEWMEEYYPEVFASIQQRVREGRWELVGGMWVEPDLNMPDGESLVRQLVVGKRYFKSRFNVDVKVGWNLDSFGFSWQMPQIYKKAGIDYFVTTKMEWNDTTPFRANLFRWESPDGSQVLCYFPKGYDYAVKPSFIAAEVNAIASSTGLDQIMYLYSVGEDGMREGRSAVDGILRLQAEGCMISRIDFATAISFFDDLEGRALGDSAPIWRDELYLQFHRGVFTTQARVKARIRRCEVLLLSVEKLAAAALLGGASYSDSDLLKLWKKLLFNQFHDIMPGTGIGVNFAVATRDLEVIEGFANSLLSKACEALSLRVHTASNGIPVVLFNTLSWERSSVVILQVQLPLTAGAQVQVQDCCGRTLLADLVSYDENTHLVKVRLLATNIPPLGFTVVYLRAHAGESPGVTPVVGNSTELENEYLRLTVDSSTGNITQLVTKSDDVNIVGNSCSFNVLQVFADKPKTYDAWNIDRDFDTTLISLDVADTVSNGEAGLTQKSIVITRRFRDSIFTQEISLFAGVPYVVVRNLINWRERHTLLKAAFPVDVTCPVATFEIPYGTIARPTTRLSQEDQAKFEVPALRWADVSNSGRGLAVLNTSKYGYDVKDNVLRLTLLRSPTWPDPNADYGEHDFVYALYPHSGGWREGRVMQYGYELNTPIIPLTTTAHEGNISSRDSFIDITPANVILSVVKKAEGDDCLVLRWYEWEGIECDVRLKFPLKILRVAETDLMEEVLSEVQLSEDKTTVIVRTGAYEIKTIKLWLIRSTSEASRPESIPAAMDQTSP